MWRVKNNLGLCNVVLTSFGSSTKRDWYFDSGNSRHMTGDKNYISYLKVVGFRQVTFGEGATRKIDGKGKLKYPGLPALDDVMLVEGVTTYLISISQPCDQGLNVNFMKDQCLVTDNAKALVMTGK